MKENFNHYFVDTLKNRYADFKEKQHEVNIGTLYSFMYS